MGWFVAIVVSAYLVMAVFWSKRYYLRRHGVVASRGDVGATSAGLIGLLWPITIWFEAVRNPGPCKHARHTRERLDAELTHIPMPSAQKPDINGLREGDRVRLIEAFDAPDDGVHYEAGSEGTILVTNTSPADVGILRDTDLHEVYVDNGGLILVSGRNIKRIDGRATVVYSSDGQHVQVVPAT